MKLTVEQLPDESGLIAPWSAVFQAPGGTIGRSADNALHLPDPTRGICRVQAAVRITDDACYLINLSSMSQVRVNGRKIAPDQSLPLAPGDELQIGPYTIRAHPLPAPAEMPDATGAVAGSAVATAHTALAEPDPLLDSPLLEPAAIDEPPTAVAAKAAASQTSSPLSEINPVRASLSVDPLEASAGESATISESAQPEPYPDLSGVSASTQESDALFARSATADTSQDPLASPKESGDDIFSDLFGPGTLPVGSVPDVATHPFDMESAQVRNPEDPLQALPRGDATVRGPTPDPLDLLNTQAGDEVDSVFSDSTPSTLPAHDPLAAHRLDPVRDTLTPGSERASAPWTARDHTRETGGFLRPARVKTVTPAPAHENRPPHDALDGAPGKRK